MGEAGGVVAMEARQSAAAAASPAAAPALARTKRTYAILFGYTGGRFHGMQKQSGPGPPVRTVEGELEAALHAVGGISADGFGDFRKTHWSRLGRTDRGVHAACQVVSVRLQVGGAEPVAVAPEIAQLYSEGWAPPPPSAAPTAAARKKLRKEESPPPVLTPNPLFDEADTETGGTSAQAASAPAASGPPAGADAANLLRGAAAEKLHQQPAAAAPPPPQAVSGENRAPSAASGASPASAEVGREERGEGTVLPEVGEGAKSGEGDERNKRGGSGEGSRALATAVSAPNAGAAALGGDVPAGASAFAALDRAEQQFCTRLAQRLRQTAPEMRLYRLVRVTKAFDARTAACRRVYRYVVPVQVLAAAVFAAAAKPGAGAAKPAAPANPPPAAPMTADLTNTLRSAESASTASEVKSPAGGGSCGIAKAEEAAVILETAAAATATAREDTASAAAPTVDLPRSFLACCAPVTPAERSRRAAALKDFAQQFIGTHSFHNFTRAANDGGGLSRYIESIEVHAVMLPDAGGAGAGAGAKSRALGESGGSVDPRPAGGCDGSGGAVGGAASVDAASETAGAAADDCVRDSSASYRGSATGSDGCAADSSTIFNPCDALILTITGQSFLLNQIRKMVALLIEMVRGTAPANAVQASLRRENRRSLHLAPAEGLFLFKPVYRSYNRDRASPPATPLLDFSPETALGQAVDNFANATILRTIADDFAGGIWRTWLDDVNRHPYIAEE